MTVINLTLPVSDGMPVYPGDPQVRFSRCPEADTGGFVVHEITFGTHTGTHLDAPAHVGGTVGVNDPHILMASVGRAMLVSVDAPAESEITPSHLGPALDRIGNGDRIIINTGWSTRFGQPEYHTLHPSISPALAALLADRRIALLGIDTPSVHTSLSREVHNILFDAGIVIVENLANLDRIPVEQFLFIATPLSLEGLDGSPVRAIAFID